MARDYITIGSSPAGEDCAQVGSDNYAARARRECNVFIKQLRRQFGEEKGSARLAVKGFPHDFGTYYEVVCFYNDEDETGTDYAFKLEGAPPETWDDEAKRALWQEAE